MRHSRIAERLRELVDRRDAAQSGTFHAITLVFDVVFAVVFTLICGFLDCTI